MELVSNFLEKVLTSESLTPQATDSGSHAMYAPSASTASGRANPTTSAEHPITENMDSYRKKNESGLLRARRKAAELDFMSYFMTSKQSGADGNGSSTSIRNSVFMDKLLEKMIDMIVPIDTKATTSELNQIKFRIDMQKQRPPLSVNTLSTNTVNLNARLSFPFLMIDYTYRFFNWSQPSFTFGMLLLITILVLNPVYLSILPPFIIINNVLVPYYLHIHSPDPAAQDKNGSFQLDPTEESLNSWDYPKPLPELSREFVLNLTDIQNHQVLYIQTWDAWVWFTKEYLYWKDDQLSSFILLSIFSIIIINCCTLPVIISLLWNRLWILKGFIIFSVWTVSILANPGYRNIILDYLYHEETRLKWLNYSNKLEDYANKVLTHTEVDDTPVYKVVEIYELQCLSSNKVWERLGFTDCMYTINNPIRKQGLNLTYKEKEEDGQQPNNNNNNNNLKSSRIIKKLSLKDVLPPTNWVFVENQWKLDLFVSNWVARNLVGDVTFIDEDEKWAYDFNDETGDIFRRRRWVRHVRRETEADRKAKDIKSDKDTEEIGTEKFSDYLI